MANRRAGVTLSADGVQKYISDLSRAGDANKDFLKSLSGSGNISSVLGNAGKQGGSAFGIGFAAGIGAAIGTAVIDAAKAAVNLGVDILKQGFAAGEYIVKIGVDYQQAIADIEAGLVLIHPDLLSVDQIFDPKVADTLRKTINEIAIDPKLVVDFKEAASQAQILTRYGFSVKQITDGALRSAVLLQNSVGGSFDLAAEVIAKYQLINDIPTDKLGEAASQIAATTVIGGFRNLNDYRYAISNASGALQIFGQDQTDINTLLAVSNKLYASGRTDGTGLRTFVENFVPTTEKAAGAMEALNIQLFDANGSFIGLQPAVRQLRKVFAGLTEQEKIYNAEVIFGKTGGKFLLTLLSQTTDATIEQTKAMILAANAQDAAAIRASTLGERFRNLGGQIESLFAALFPAAAQDQVSKPFKALQDALVQLAPAATAAGLSFAEFIGPLSNELAAAIKQASNALAGQPFLIDISNIQFGKAGGHTTLKISDLFTLDTTPDTVFVSLLNGALQYAADNAHVALSIGKVFGFIDNTITGDVKIALGNYTVDFNTTELETAVGGFGLYLQGIPARLAESFPKTTGEALDRLSQGLGMLGGVVTLADLAIKEISAPDGGLGRLRTFVTTTIQGVGQALQGVDQSKLISVGGAIGTTITTVVNALTTLSDIGNVNIGTAVKGLTDISTGLLNFATGLTEGINGEAIGKASAGFVASLIDEFTIALAAPDLPGLAEAASGFILAISKQFKNALTGGQLTVVGASLGEFVNTLVDQLGKTLSNPAFGTQLGQSFANIIVAITKGASDLLKGFSEHTNNELQNAQIGGGISSFVTNFLDGVSTGLASADYGKVVSRFVKSLLGSLLGGDAVRADLADISANGGNFKNIFKLLKDINELGGTNPFVAAGAAMSGSTPETQAEELHRTVEKLNAENLAILQNRLLAPPDQSDMMGAFNVKPAAGIQPTIASQPVANFDALTQTFSDLDAQSKTAGASLVTAGNIIVAGAQTTAGTLAATPFFPGWGAVLGPPLDLPAFIPPFPGWDAYITSINLQHQVSAVHVTGGFAGGTPYVPMTGSYLVGERGPEIVALPRGASVIPNHKIGKVLGAYSTGTPGATTATPIDIISAFIDKIKRGIKPIKIEVAAAIKDAKINPPATNFLPSPFAPKNQQFGPPSSARPLMPISATLLDENQKSQIGDDLEQTTSEIKDAAQAFSGTLKDLNSALQKVPGLFGASPVTQEQMDAGAAGIPQNFADDFVRRLGAEVKNGNQEFGNLLPQAIEALGKVGITPGNNPQAILAQIKETFASGQLFSNKENLGLINQDAVKADIAKQEQQKAGQTNIQSFFDSLFGFSAAEMEAGGQGASTKTAKSAAATGAGTEVPFPGWTGEGGLIPNFPDWAGKGGLIPNFPGWAKPNGFVPELDWSEYVAVLSSTPAPATPDVPAQATGANSFRGGSVLTGENGPELSVFPAGTRIFPAKQTSKIMGIAEALARTLPGIHADPVTSAFNRGMVSQPQTQVVYHRQSTAQTTANHTKVFNLNVRSDQQSNNIVRDFQSMQVQAGV